MPKNNNMKSQRKGQTKYFTAEQVVNYVNKTLLMRPRNVERKWFSDTSAQWGMTCGQPIACNPFYWLAQGVAQNQRLGLDIQNVHLNIKMNYTQWGTTVAVAPVATDGRVRLLVLANPTPWHTASSGQLALITGGIGTNLTVGTTFLNSGTNQCTSSWINKDINKVLYDSGPLHVRSSFINTNTATGASVTCKASVKLGDLRYQANGTQSYLRDDQVYIMMVSDHDVAGGAPAATDITGFLNYEYFVTFADS